MDVTDDRPGPMRIILIGMMGSGKSSVGRALATRTGWPFHDNDALVERATGRTARELLATEGEAGLRAAEGAALEVAVTTPAPAIVGLAAGTILEPSRRRRTAEAGFVVWLRAPAGVLAERAVMASHRPWLEGDAAAWFAETSAKRAPLYAEIADLEIDSAETDPSKAADRILGALGDR